MLRFAVKPAHTPNHPTPPPATPTTPKQPSQSESSLGQLKRDGQPSSPESPVMPRHTTVVGEEDETIAVLQDHRHDSRSSHPAAQVEPKAKKFLNPFHLSFVLENRGSVARDHLALERTYLAYVRTSLAISSAGVGTELLIFLFYFLSS